MFNSKLKQEWLNRLDDVKEEYFQEMIKAQETTIQLFETRKNAVLVVKQIENFINTIVNTPKEYKVKLDQVNLRLQEFREVIDLKDESELATKISGSIAGTGALAGAGVAALGPTAAMAIATTFGTASTGTAIASLSGAAATNAALAWLGGGALAAGKAGGGMAAGKALLALAGPVGWAIGGTAIVGSVLIASSKNKKIAEEAEENVFRIKEQINYVIKTKAEIIATEKITAEHFVNLDSEMHRIADLVRNSKPKRTLAGKVNNFFQKISGKEAISPANNVSSYSEFDADLKKELGSLVNNTLSLAELIEKKVG